MGQILKQPSCDVAKREKITKHVEESTLLGCRLVEHSSAKGAAEKWCWDVQGRQSQSRDGEYLGRNVGTEIQSFKIRSYK